jgi:lipopolysaccharide export system protein LptA
MEYKHKENESHVTGNAYAERTITPAYPDSPPQHQVLTADNFHIYFHPNSPDNSSSQTFQSINYIKAKGNVTFKYEYLIIQADHCVYYAGSSSDKIQTAGRIICTQNVTLKKGNNTLKGEKAEADLNNGTYKVTTSGSSKKVEAILTPSQIRPEK